nr:MAG TPA: hypothetical protein [Caudoviricetes sp.]
MVIFQEQTRWVGLPVVCTFAQKSGVSACVRARRGVGDT